MEEKRTPHLIKIGQAGNKFQDSTLIGVIDSSGSMSSYWKHVSFVWNQFTQDVKDKHLVTFSSQAMDVKNCQVITDRIYDYGGATTDIGRGFTLVNQKLKLEITQDNITILFISDGQDNNMNDIEKRLEKIRLDIKKYVKINFITVGVGSQFPTFLAMKLRDMYHSGENNIPPVFLISEPYQKEDWEVNFQSIKPILQHQAKVRFQKQQLVKPFPWSQSQDYAYENSWIISESKEVCTENGQVYKALEGALHYPDMIEIMKQWQGEISLVSLKKDVKDYAKKALEIINQWKQDFLGLGCGNIQQIQKTTFHQKMLKKMQSGIEKEFNLLVKEFKAFNEENILEKLSEQEAAKRLAIGTKLGKYHGKAIMISGLTVDDYLVAKQKFVEIFSNTTLNPESDQEHSVISLQNQKDVFLETDFIQGIKLCPSQYDLVEALPLVGHAIRLKRSDGSMINPYMVNVLGIAKHHNVIDTVSLQASENNELKLKTGNDEEEIVNAVLPLFGEKDKDLKPLITSKIYSILMTFNVMQNADTCYDNAYIALLANTLVYLLGSEVENSTWKTALLDKIYITTKITYSQSSGFKKYAEALLNNPRMATVTDHPDSLTKCEDLSKALLVLYYLYREGAVKETEVRLKILDAIFADVFGRLYPTDVKISSFFELKNKEALKKLDFSVYAKKLIEDFPSIKQFYTIQEIRNELTKRVVSTKIVLDIDFSANLSFEKLFFMKEGKFSLKKLEQISKYFFFDSETDPTESEKMHQELFSEKNVILWLRHAYKYRNSFERNKTDMKRDLEQVMEEISTEIQSNVLQNNTIFEDTFKVLNTQFTEYMIDTHQFVTPMTKDQLATNLKQLGKEKQIDQYKFNTVSNLLKNACMAPKCPFYLCINNSLSGHMESFLSCPAFHKTIKLMAKSEKTSEEILQCILKGDCIEMPDQIHVASSRCISDITKKKLKDNWENYIQIVTKIRKMYQDQ